MIEINQLLIDYEYMQGAATTSFPGYGKSTCDES